MKYDISGQSVHLHKRGVGPNFFYDVEIGGARYEIYGEPLYDGEFKPNFRYGEVIYPSECAPDLLKEGSEMLLECLKSAIESYNNENSDIIKFFEYD